MCAFFVVRSLEGSKFERLGRGFEYHVRFEHKLWNYIYLMTYLDVKVLPLRRCWWARGGG